MRTLRLITAASVIVITALTTQPQAVASDQELIITKNGNSRAAIDNTPSNSSTSEIASLHLPEDLTPITKDTPTGKQVEWTISDKSSPATQTFKVEMNGDITLEVHQESGAIIARSNGYPTLMIESPWAKDADGHEVPTYFTVDGSTFTQHVETDAGDYTYPITADPRINWGIVSGHAYFSKEETKRMAAGAAAAAAISPFWVIVPPPAGEAIGYWWASNSYSVAAWATAAAAQNKCLALKIGVTGTAIPPSVGVTPEHYTDGCL